MRGITIAIFLLSVMLSFSLLAGVGFMDAAGIQVDPGTGDVDQVEGEFGNQSVQDAEETGFLGFTSSVVDTVSILWVLITNTSEIVLLFIPSEPIANTVETGFRIVFGLTIAQIIRGLIFE